MGSPAIFKGKRTGLLTQNGLALKSGAVIDNDGPINLLANGHFEENTTPWFTFADGASYVDGTGGTPTLTLTRDTTDPLYGVAHGLITPGTLGDGISCDMEIAPAHRGRILALNLDYMQSGTTAEGDFQVWFCDVTNGVRIQPSGYALPSGVANVPYSSAQVLVPVPSDCETLRVSIYQAVTTSVTLKIDNVSVGPQVKTYGMPSTDKRPVTGFTVSNLGTGSATVTAQARRVGDTWEVSGRILKDASAGTGSSSLILNFPSGYTIDSDKISAGTPTFGYGIYESAGSNDHLAVTYFTTTSVRFYQNDATYLIGSEFAANTGVTFNFKVPILGWSSNTLMSSSADTRVVALAVQGSSTSISSSAADIVWTTTQKDSHGTFNGTTYTIAVPGWYFFQAKLRINSASASSGNGDNIYLLRNGTEIARGVDWRAASQTSGFPSVDKLYYCEAGDTIKIQADSSATTPSISGTQFNNNFSVFMLTGPSQIAASETIIAVAKNGAGTSIANATITRVPTPTIEIDTHGALATTGIFTCPAPGKYRVNATAHFSANSTGARSILIYKNSSAQTENFVLGTATTTASLTASKVFDCLAGDTLDYRAYQTSGGSLALTSQATENYVTFERIGL